MPTHILIGPMGVGKTSIGQSLAKRLAVDFHDTDLMVEERTKQSISEIFVEQGEESFRKLEYEELLQGLNFDGVLALGGGACVTDLAQRAIRNSRAKVIFLDISLKEVAARVGFDSARPLLAINPRSQWQSLMDARRPIYLALAEMTIQVDGKSIGEIVDEIVGGA